MNERDLEYFAVIAEQGQLGRAAEALGLSQPALSMSLRRLEKSMQTKLVKRTPKGIELTATGSALLSHLGQLQLAHEDVVREVADLSQGRAGDLSGEFAHEHVLDDEYVVYASSKHRLATRKRVSLADSADRAVRL